MRSSKQANKQTSKHIASARHEGFLHGFLASVIGVAICYVAISLYTNLIFASTNLSPLKKYLSTDDLYKTQNYPNCPDFESIVDTVAPIDSRMTIIKEKCSNTYWPPFDLPNTTQNKKCSGDRITSCTTNTQCTGNGTCGYNEYIGYTYEEAKAFCEQGGLYRLPTTDELLALVKVPCSTPGNCSPTSLFNQYGTGVVSGTKYYANGLYWALNPLDIIPGDDVLAGEESASSVSLKDGTVNTPIMGKDMRLNVRCIYNKPRDLAPIVAGTNVTNFNSLEWISIGAPSVMKQRSAKACTSNNECFSLTSGNYPICDIPTSTTSSRTCFRVVDYSLPDQEVVGCPATSGTNNDLVRDDGVDSQNPADDVLSCQ